MATSADDSVVASEERNPILAATELNSRQAGLSASA
jgi:hypothetical protein